MSILSRSNVSAGARAPSSFAPMRILSVLGTLFFIAAIFVVFQGEGRPTALVPLRGDTECASFGSGYTGEHKKFSFTLHNDSDKPIRILGAARACGRYGCIEAELLPITIPARSIGYLPLLATLSPTTAGELRETITLFTDQTGVDRFPLTVEGSVVAFPAPTPELEPGALAPR